MEGLRLHGLVCLWLLKVICGTRFEVRGREHIPEGSCLVVAKHQSTWDTFALVPLFRDPAIVLKAELARIPLYVVPTAPTVVESAAGYCEFINNIDARRRIAVDINPETTRRAADGVEVVLTTSSDLWSKPTPAGTAGQGLEPQLPEPESGVLPITPPGNGSAAEYRSNELD